MSMLNQTTIQAEIGRSLGLEDKALMSATRLGSTTPKLKKIRAVHHAAARLMATGMKNAEVSMNVGLCVSRLSILQNDPAFADLITHYTEAEKERFASVQDRMAMLGMVASEELTERILEAPEEMTSKDLTEVMKISLDRGGYAPITKSETKSTHLVLGPADLAKIKQSTEESANGRVIHRRPTKTLPADIGRDTNSDADSERAVPSDPPRKGLTLEGLDL